MNSTDAFASAYELGKYIGRLEEKNRIMELALKASTDDNSNIMGHDRIGNYVYLEDLYEYLRIDDEQTRKD